MGGPKLHWRGYLVTDSGISSYSSALPVSNSVELRHCSQFCFAYLGNILDSSRTFPFFPLTIYMEEHRWPIDSLYGEFLEEDLLQTLGDPNYFDDLTGDALLPLETPPTLGTSSSAQELDIPRLKEDKRTSELKKESRHRRGSSSDHAGPSGSDSHHAQNGPKGPSTNPRRLAMREAR